MYKAIYLGHIYAHLISGWHRYSCHWNSIWNKNSQWVDTLCGLAYRVFIKCGCGHWRKMNVQILSFTLSSCIILDKSFNFSKPRSPHVVMILTSLELVKGWSKEAHICHSAWDKETLSEYIFIFALGRTECYF